MLGAFIVKTKKGQSLTLDPEEAELMVNSQLIDLGETMCQAITAAGSAASILRHTRSTAELDHQDSESCGCSEYLRKNQMDVIGEVFEKTFGFTINDVLDPETGHGISPTGCLARLAGITEEELAEENKMLEVLRTELLEKRGPFAAILFYLAF